MTIKDYLNQYFNLNVTSDEEGVYKYHIHEENGKINASSTVCPSSDTELVLECDDSNYFALMYAERGKIRLMMEGTKLSGAEILDKEYDNAEGDHIIEKGFVFYSENWIKKYLRVDLYPHICVSMEIDYEQYETDEDGVVIWE